MSSDKLAELCEVGPVHIRKIESGAKAPSIHLFVKICNALHTSPQYLLQDSLEPNELDSQLKMLEKIDHLPSSKTDMLYMFLTNLSENE